MASDDDYYCPGCGAVLPIKPPPPSKSRAPLLIGGGLAGIVGLVIFVSAQHQAIIAQSRASEAIQQQHLADEARLQAPPPPPSTAPVPIVMTPQPAYVPPTVQSGGDATSYTPTQPSAPAPFNALANQEANANAQDIQTLLSRQAGLLQDKQEATSFEELMEHGVNGHPDPGTTSRIAGIDKELADVQTQLAQLQSEQAQHNQH